MIHPQRQGQGVMRGSWVYSEACVNHMEDIILL